MVPPSLGLVSAHQEMRAAWQASAPKVRPQMMQVGSTFGAFGISNLPGAASRSVLGGGRLRFDDTVRTGGGNGRLIRHAEATAFPVVPLPVAVIEPPLLALLVLLVGILPLLTALFLPASVAAVPVAPVTMTTDPEHRPTANTPANPSAQEFLAGPPSPPYAAGGDNREPSWQSRSHLQMTWGRFFGPVQKNPIAACDRGFSFPPSAPPCHRLGKPHR